MEIDGSVRLDDDAVVEEILLDLEAVLDGHLGRLDGILDVLGLQIWDWDVRRLEEERSGRTDSASSLFLHSRRGIRAADAKDSRIVGQSARRLFDDVGQLRVHVETLGQSLANTCLVHVVPARRPFRFGQQERVAGEDDLAVDELRHHQQPSDRQSNNNEINY